MVSFKLVNYTFFLLICVFYSCSAVKFVPEEKYLLDKVKIESDTHGCKNLELNSYLKQNPNYKMFGIFKTKLHIYNLSGKDSTKWSNRLIRKMGEPPVIFDSTLTYETEIELKKLLVNAGYLHTNVTSKILFCNKKAHIIYQIQGNTPCYINSYTLCIEDSLIKKELQKKLEVENPHLRTSLIKPGILFDRNLLNAERERITLLLQNRGYFKFSKKDIAYNADSASNSIDLKLVLHFSDDAISYGANRKFYYDSVFIYVDYNPFKKIINFSNYPKQDILVQNGYTIYYSNIGTNSNFFLKPNILLSNCFIVPTEPYSQLKEELTSISLENLHLLNNTYIQLNEKTRNDSSLLDCHIFITPSHPQAISLSVEGTNTSGNFGIVSSLDYTHQNLFQKAKTFNFQSHGVYEIISDFPKSHRELEGKISLHIPKFFSNLIKISSLKYYTSTNASISYNLSSRPEYNRILFSSAIQLQWKKRLSHMSFHSFNLLSIDYYYFFRENFSEKSPIYTKPIIATNYSFLNSFPDSSKKNTYKFQMFVESAGNTLYLLNSILNQRGFQSFYNPFAQFVKTEIGYSQNKKINFRNSLVSRIAIGIAIPYGNSQILPLEKKYYSGGSNSVRAWRSGELGPGACSSDTSTVIYFQSGDIKLDFNIEYRTKFFWKLEFATFIDTGNIWCIKNCSKQKEGVFYFNSFFKEIAIGYGLGLRFNFDYFILRFDCAEKAYNPAELQKKKLVLFHPDLKENFAWYFTIGYPF